MALHQLKELVAVVSGSRGSRTSTRDERSTRRCVAGGLAVLDVVENVVLVLYRLITA